MMEWFFKMNLWCIAYWSYSGTFGKFHEAPTYEVKQCSENAARDTGNRLVNLDSYSRVILVTRCKKYSQHLLETIEKIFHTQITENNLKDTKTCQQITVDSYPVFCTTNVFQELSSCLSLEWTTFQGHYLGSSFSEAKGRVPDLESQSCNWVYI